MATNSGHLMCPTCLQEYSCIINTPILLPCLHSICRHCLEKLIENLTVSEEKVYQFQCPVCVKIATKPSDLPVEKWAGRFPVNAVLQSLLPKAKTKVDQLCDPCLYVDTSIAATSYCTTCKEALCELCDSAHRKSRASREHTFLTLDEIADPSIAVGLSVSITCTYHSNIDMNLYCASHDSLCCSDCIIDYHRGCNNILKLQQHADKLLQAKEPVRTTERIRQLESHLDKYTAVSNENLQELETSTKDMTIEIDKLISTLNEAKSKISMERECLLEDESRKRCSETQKCQTLKAALRDSLILLDTVVKYGNGHQSCVILHKIKEQLAYCEKTIHDKYSDVRQVEARLQLNKHFISLRKLTESQIAMIEITENKLKQCLPIQNNYAVTSDSIHATIDEGLPSISTMPYDLASDEDGSSVENSSDFYGQKIRACDPSSNLLEVTTASTDGHNESQKPVKNKRNTLITSGNTAVAREIESKPQKENAQTQRMIRVLGLAKSVSKDALELFFENKKRSGGGDIEKLEWGRNKGEAFITFKDPSVVQSVIEKQNREPFYLEQMKLTVEEYVPPPPDPLRLFLKNLSPKVTHELLILYLESRCNAAPTEILFGRLPGTALVTFSEPPELQDFCYDPHIRVNIGFKIHGHQCGNNKFNWNSYLVVRKHRRSSMMISVFGSALRHVDCSSVFEVQESLYFDPNIGVIIGIGGHRQDVELLLKKVKERPLEGQNIQVIRVPVTSSIQLSGLSLSTTRDTVELYFENPKRSDGGPVADVKLARKKQSCIVSFKYSEDAERVCMKPHTIDKKDVQVCLYYECLDDDLDAEEFSDLTHGTEDTVDEFKLPDPVEFKDLNPQILRFLSKNEKHRQLFEKNLSDVNGVAKWPSSVEGCVIIECTVKMEDNSASSILEDWSSRVVDRVNSFTAGIEVVKFNPMQMAWSRVIERLQTVTIDNPEDLGVFVEQENNDITVAGPKAAVEKLKKTILDIIAQVETQIELEKQRVKETKPVKSYDMSLLRETHFKQNIEKIFPGLQFDLKDNMAVFVGQADIVQKAVVQMHEKLQSFVSISMPMSKASKDLLFGKEVKDYIKQKMKSQKIIGVWDVVRREEVRMIGQDEKEVKKAIQLVRNCLLEKEILLDEIKARAVEGQQWPQLVQGMQEKHARKVVIETSMRSILIVAVDDIFQDVFDEINVYLEKHSVVELFFTLDPVRVKFFKRFKNEDIKALEKRFAGSHVKLSVIEYGDKKGIKINGTRDACNIVKTEVAKMANNVITKEHRMVSKEGLKEFLQGYKWTNKLIYLEKNFKCFVEMKDSGTSSNLEQEGATAGHSSKSEGNADQSYEAMDWQPSADSGGDSIDVCGIKVSVVQGELAKQKVDVIVNSASQTFDLNIGAVSKTILKYDGDSIQSECRQQYHIGLNPGQVVVTSGGKLSCKMVYHGCLLDYSCSHGNPIEVMRTFVMNCLVEADKNGFKSMAFPALGTGNLGFPADEVGKLMVECIKNFGRKNTYTTLENIALVVYPTDTNIIKAFTTVLGGTTVPSASAQRSASSSSNISTVHGICKCTLPHLVVLEILQGDITKETTDVIVNSVLSDLNLSQGQVSKAILTAGGMSIQQACQSKDADFKMHGYVVTRSGILPCKKIVHMAVQDEDYKWKDIIKRVLIETEQSGYRSISFPALGTGGKFLSPEKIAQVMYSACTEFAKSQPFCLKKIRVVLFQETMLTRFVQAISSGQGESQVSSTPVAGRYPTRKSKQGSLVFNITADSEFNVNEAIKDLEGFLKLHSF